MEKYFNETVEMIRMDEVEGRCSTYGNTFAIITEEQIEELHNGKIVYIDDGEYCHFIRLKKEA